VEDSVKTLTRWRVGSATHAGRARESNEDRLLADTANGIFLVVDGMGGHAAGEIAADIAVREIRETLIGSGEAASVAIRQAITKANNCILATARENPAWLGMACVLTLAVLDEDTVTWGHVGDSRLYLFQGGVLRKLTRDHSPVGEREDRGELSEQEAMRHPRRNEVFRDVGSVPRRTDEEGFIACGSDFFPPDSALLLCSDGLSDALTAEELRMILESFDGDAEAVARQLISAANQRSGADNVSAVFIAGPTFAGQKIKAAAEGSPRHTITRVRPKSGRWFSFDPRKNGKLFWLLAGILLGFMIAFGWQHRAEFLAAWSRLVSSWLSQPARK
jgi:PPM family protein phosphatase